MPRLAITLVALLAAFLIVAPAMAEGSSQYVFRSSKTGVLPWTDFSGEGPEQNPLVLSHDLPASVRAGTALTLFLSASGGNGSPYFFSAVEEPRFVSVLPDGTVVIEPAVDDIGEHHGIVLTVSDGTSSSSTGPISITVIANDAPLIAYHMPVSATLQGTPVTHQLLFDGKSGTASRVTLTGQESLEYQYAEPITAYGAYVNVGGTSPSAVVEAMVDGEWTEVLLTSGTATGDRYTEAGEAVTSDRWRIKRRATSGSSAYVYEFRPGPAPAHVGPSFITPAGYVARRGETAQIIAEQPISAYSDEPITYSLPEGVAPPQGVTVSPEGTVAVAADADIATTWAFDLVATDGVGATAVRRFHVTKDAPLAEEVMAHDFTTSSGPADYRYMYDGQASAPDEAIAISQTSEAVVDFGFAVQADKAVLGFANMNSLSRARLDYEIDGEWVEGPVFAAADSGKPMAFSPVSARRFRVIATNSHAFSLTEFRVGGGPAHAWPSFDGSAYIATLGEEEAEISIPYSAASTYGASPAMFELVSGTLPLGGSLSEDGVLALPSASAAEGAGWSFEVKVTDGQGFSTQRTLSVGGDAVPASTVMATAVTSGNEPVDHRVLYDGASGIGYAIKPSQPLTVDFGLPVSFGEIFGAFSSASANVTVEVETDGGWAFAGNYTTVGGSIPLDGTYVARRVRLASVTSLTVRELRIGNGPAHAAPVHGQDGIIADLGDEPQSVLLSAAASEHYYQPAPVTFSLQAGQLPHGAVLSPDGLLSLPSAADADGFTWAFVVRATDGLGFVSDNALSISSTGIAVPASQVMAVKVTRGETPGEYQSLYDGKTDANSYTIASSISSWITIDFGRPVFFDRFVSYATGTVSLQLEIETPSGWLNVGSFAYADNSTPKELGDTYTAQRVRIRGTVSNSIREFRLGAGPAHSAPILSQSGLVATLDTQPKQVQLSADSPTHYTASPLTYEIASGTLPDGASLSAFGMLSLPSEEQAGTGTWEFTVRVTDGMGVSADAPLRVVSLNNAVPASGVMATNVTQGSNPADHLVLYDGKTDVNNYNVSSNASTWIVIDFGIPVSFDRFQSYLNGTVSLDFDIETPDGWINIDKFATADNASPKLLDAFYSAQRIRIKGTSSSSTTVREFRLGAGAANFAPVLQVSVMIPLLGVSPMGLSLEPTSSPYSHQPLVFDVVGGSLPTGAALTEAGVLDLPAASEAGGFNWSPIIRVTDELGQWSEARLFIGVPSAPAATTLPISALSGTTQYLANLYDSSSSTATTAIKELIIEFSDPVEADSVTWGTNNNWTGRKLTLAAEFDGQFADVVTWDASSSGSQTRTVPGTNPMVAKRFRLTTSGTTTIPLHTLKIGKGGIYPGL